MKNLNVLGVCAGGGALLHPFLKNHRVIANVEPRHHFHYRDDQQWKLNFRDIPFVRAFNLSWNPDIIVGSPDCGANSVMRLSKVKVLGDSKDNDSINLYLWSILNYKPKVFLLENLPRLVPTLKEIWDNMAKDYDLVFHTTSVIDFGNSQKSRVRSIIIGIKKDNSGYSKNNFNKIFQVTNPKVTKELLHGIYKSDPSNYAIPKNKVLAMYDYRNLPDKKNLTVRQIKRLWIGDFKEEYKWPIKQKKMHTLPGVYRLREDQYPLTVRPADRQFRPDGYPLGIKDIKSIMGFPNKFKVYIDPDNYLTTINKARYTLAKGSVYEVGQWFLKCLESSR